MKTGEKIRVDIGINIVKILTKELIIKNIVEIMIEDGIKNITKIIFKERNIIINKIFFQLTYYVYFF